MERRTVVKFGGTSLKTADAICKAVHIIENNTSIRVVVVSAAGGITNQLIQFFQSSYMLRQEILSQIKLFHLDILKELKLNEKVTQEILEIIKRLDKLCSTNLNLAHLDEILAVGEQLSSLFVYHLLNQRNHPVVLINAKEILITDDHFGKANPQIDLIKERTNNKIQSLPKDTIVVTQGFIGATIDGRATTLGRGGSDFSAALLAEAILADKLHIYTDVKGVYTMDPNVIQNARLINAISFQEMAELANFGAKILHPATLAPCVRSKIPVTISSTFEPDQGNTCIMPDTNGSENTSPLIRAIAMRKKQMLVTIKSLNMLNACGFLATVFSILARYKISVDLITTSEVSVALTIDGTNLGSHEINPFTDQNLVDELNAFSEISIEEDLTLVTVVGKGLTIPGISQNILGKIIDYSIRIICYGASTSNIGFLVRNQDSNSVVSTLHKEFIENNG